jgi:thiol-disulfide isomerase/thioredoxin
MKLSALGLPQRIIESFVLVFICQNINAQPFTLKGTIKGKDSGYVILSYKDENNSFQYKVSAINQGKFQFEGRVASSDYAVIDTDTNYIYKGKRYGTALFIEPGIISITFKDGEADKAIVKGSKTQDEFTAFKKSQKKGRDELTRVNIYIDSIRTHLKNGSIDPQTAEQKEKEVLLKLRTLALSLQNSELSYIAKHRNSYLSLNLLRYLTGRISNDSIDALYLSLTEKVKSSSVGYRFIENYSRIRKALSAEYPFDKLKMNEKAPSFFISNTLTNNSMTVDDFKGEVIIFEFWGLSCFPCLKANPLLEAIRKQHGNDKLKIIAINDNQVREIPALVSYINKNKLSEWIHVFMDNEVKSISNLIYKGDFNNYAGLGVPRTVVIDKNGKIAYKNYGYSIEEMQKLKLLIDKLVNEN